jgi:hypothetical protein
MGKKSSQYSCCKPVLGLLVADAVDVLRMCMSVVRLSAGLSSWGHVLSAAAVGFSPSRRVIWLLY